MSLCPWTWNAHHRFVKTTPKPSATKNNSGEEPELLPPPLLLLPPLSLVVAGGRAELVDGNDEPGSVGVGAAALERILVAVWRAWCWNARTTRLAMPANSGVSKTIAATARITQVCGGRTCRDGDDGGSEPK